MKILPQRWRSFFVEQKVVALLLIAAILKGTWDLGRLAWFYLVHHPINWDTLVYLTIGRGILNGLKPYTGLYEMKPPGIFLISALSLAITGDETFGLWLQVMLQCLIPLLFAWAAWKMFASAGSNERIFAVAAAVAFGLAVSLYAESRSLAFQSEGFGFFFALVFVIAIALPGGMTRMRTAAAAIGILGSVGMKEPFLLSGLAAALVLQDGSEPAQRHLWKKFLLPLLIAAGAGLALMMFLGYLKGYVTVHLPFVFNTRLTDGLPIPLRGFSIGHVLMDLFIPPLSLFGLLVGFFFVVALWSDRLSPSKNRRLLLCFAGSILLSTLLWFVLEDADIVPRLEWPNVNVPRLAVRALLSLDGTSVTWAIGLAVFVALLLGETVFLAPREGLRKLLLLLLSLYLVSLAVAAGGFFGSHMLFALPLYCALFFVFLRRLKNHPDPRFLRAAFSLLMLATVAISFHNNHDAFLQQSVVYNSRYNARLGNTFDALLDACGIEKYFVVGDGAFLTGHSRHSPMGPLAFHLPFMPDDDPMLMNYYAKGLKTAALAVVMENGRNRDVVESMLPKYEFSPDPPSCARPLALPENYLLFFHEKRLLRTPRESFD